MIYIAIPFAVAAGLVVGFILGGILVTRMGKEIKDYNGPPVRWSPEEFEIIKRQTVKPFYPMTDDHQEPWTHPLA